MRRKELFLSILTGHRAEEWEETTPHDETILSVLGLNVPQNGKIKISVWEDGDAWKRGTTAPYDEVVNYTQIVISTSKGEAISLFNRPSGLQTRR